MENDIARVADVLVKMHLKESEARTVAEILVEQGFSDLERLQRM